VTGSRSVGIPRTSAAHPRISGEASPDLSIDTANLVVSAFGLVLAITKEKYPAAVAPPIEARGTANTNNVRANDRQRLDMLELSSEAGSSATVISPSMISFSGYRFANNGGYQLR
jgi:hypothetical protein